MFDKKAYDREYKRRKQRQLRAEWFAKTGPCVDCGTWGNLQVDHEDHATKDPSLRKGPGKKSAANLWTWGRERREKELAKCVPRCVDCHKKKTAERKEKGRGRTKLTENQVREIIQRLAEGESGYSLAKEFGLHKKAVSPIKRGITWKHLPRPWTTEDDAEEARSPASPVGIQSACDDE